MQEADAAAHALLLHAFGQEGGEEVVVALEVHQEHLAGKAGRGEQVDIFQGEGRFPESAQRGEPNAGTVMQAHAGFREKLQDAGFGLLQGFERTGEEMQGVLSGADDGGLPPCFLQGDARHHPGQASAYDYSIEFHRPSTCL